MFPLTINDFLSEVRYLLRHKVHRKINVVGFSEKETKTDREERNENKQTNKKSKAFNVVGRDLNDFSVVDTSSALRGKK
jgi:hypothetical protein